MNYLIIGDDAYLREREENKIKEKFLNSGEADINFSIYRKEDDLSDIMDSLGTLPFLADRRVILVKEVENFTESSLNTLMSYLEHPTETSVLIISADSNFKKNKHYKKFVSSMETIAADVPQAHTMKKWIKSFLEKENVDISPQAVDLIVELKGQDTAGIKAEIDKLISFSGGNKIEVKDVEQIVGRSVTETVFKLVDAIDSGDGEWAFRILNDLYNDKKQPVEIIGYLGWHMRMMQGVNLLSSKGAGVNEIASKLGYSPGYVKRLSYQAKKYDHSKIARRVSLLFETDKAIKTGQKDPNIALQMLVVEFLKDK